MLINLEQGSPEWHAFRSDKLGASDIPIIMGESPFKTPLRLWREKLGLDVPFVNDKMREGNRMEPIARKWFNDYKMANCQPVVMQSEESPWLIASLDGYDASLEVAIEIKFANDLDHEIASHGEIPNKYYGQCQCQLYVSGLDHLFYVSYRDGDGHIVPVYRDNDYIERMISVSRDFHDKMMNFEQPEMTDKDFKDMSDDSNWRGLEDRYLSLVRLKKIYEVEMENIKERLIDMSEGQNCKSNCLMIYKSVRQGNVDYKSIPELKSVDLDKYRKPSTDVWTVRCK